MRFPRISESCGSGLPRAVGSRGPAARCMAGSKAPMMPAHGRAARRWTAPVPWRARDDAKATEAEPGASPGSREVEPRPPPALADARCS